MARKSRQQDEIARLKKKYVEYFRRVPVQRYAAMYISRNEDTILRWKEEDADFAEQVHLARSEWVASKVDQVKAEFALERLEKDVFSQRQEVTGADGAPIFIIERGDGGSNTNS